MADSDYRWLNAEAKRFLTVGNEYLEEGQDLDDRVNVIANTAQTILGIPGFANKFKDYFRKGWFTLSTPIWTNFGSDRGLPISCYGSYIEDDSDSIVDTQAEVSIMSKYGGGTSAYFGALRERGSGIKKGRNGKSGGPYPFMQTYDKNISIWSQGSTRRGSLAAYLNIDHPDIMEVLAIRSKGNPIQDITFGICVEDDWLRKMKAGDEAKRKVWARLIKARSEVSMPYIFFTDTVNRNTVDVYKDKGHRILHSNLCTEIMLPTNKYWSFVCDLLSANILYYDEWKNTDLIEFLVYFLDAVMTEFIEKAKNIKHLKRAVAFAEANRALGIGWVGWHSYLQSLGIAWESMEAKYLNVAIAKQCYEQSYAASAKMAIEYGEPELLKGYGRRHATLLAHAPTTSSAFILEQVSPTSEALFDNYHIKNLAKGKYTYRNPQLKQLLKKKGKDIPEVWRSILENKGSVQHLDFLTPVEKAVYKTISEISQMEILIQASQRQKYIDQGQSINVWLDPKLSTKEKNAFFLTAWELEIKSLYYQYNENAAQQLSRGLLTCTSCEA